MRGMPVDGEGPRLLANDSASEVDNASFLAPRATGFEITKQNTYVNTSGETYIYMAIRGPMMKEPESATEVYQAFETTNSHSAGVYGTLTKPDMFLSKRTDSSATWRILERLRGGSMLRTDSTDEESGDGFLEWDKQEGVQITTTGAPYLSNDLQAHWLFKRAKGYFDVVAYTGTGSAQTVAHSLGVEPELIFTKGRSGTANWYTYSKPTGVGKFLILSSGLYALSSTTMWNNTLPTSTEFSIAAANNNSGQTYISYLFATLAGISKVGSYTGNGSSQTIDCGFTSGARFILIKRTDASGDWYFWDSVRGIVAGNDPHLALNSAAAEVTTDDSVDPASSGFIVNQVSATNINVSASEYIFYAIA